MDAFFLTVNEYEFGMIREKTGLSEAEHFGEWLKGYSLQKGKRDRF